MNYLADRVARSAMLRVKREAQKVVRLTILRLILGALGATLLTGGFFYLFQAEVKGLDALCCPPWLAYLSTGVSAILLALMAMKGILWPREEDESD